MASSSLVGCSTGGARGLAPLRILSAWMGERGSEELEAFGDQPRAKEGRASDIAAGPREAGDEAISDRIAHAVCHDGYRRGRSLGGTGGGRTSRDDEIHLETGQLGRKSRK